MRKVQGVLMRKVSIVKVKSDLEDDVGKLLQLSGAESLIAPGDNVLLKPNLHAIQQYTTGGTTNPHVVAAVVRWAYKQGAKEVIVGDSPFFGFSEPERCFTDTGMGEAVEKAGAKWVTFGKHSFRIFRNASRSLPAEIGISEFVFNCDKMINTAAMKTHLNCLVTLGMKNLKGCLRSKDKAAFHNTDINRAIVALNKLVKPDLTIVDGTIGMEGMGPAAGTPVNCSLLMAGKDVVAVDSVASSLMGIDPEEVMTIKLGHQAGLGEMDIGKIEVVGERLDEVKMKWKRPDSVIAEKFPGLTIRNKGACSGCNMNLLEALRGLTEGEITPGAIVMGQGEPVEEASVLIGKCTSHLRKSYAHLPGCPPRTAAIREFISAEVAQKD